MYNIDFNKVEALGFEGLRFNGERRVAFWRHRTYALCFALNEDYRRTWEVYMATRPEYRHALRNKAGNVARFRTPQGAALAALAAFEVER